MLRKTDTENRKKNPLKGIREGLKKALVYLMCVSMLMSNMSTSIAYAATRVSADEDESEIYSMDIESILEAVADAAENGEPVGEDEYEFSGSAAYKYNRILNTDDGSLYEIYPDLDEEGSIELKTFVRLSEDPVDGSYNVTGDEDIIYLFINDGTDDVEARIHIFNEDDIYETKVINVPATYSSLILVDADDDDEEVVEIALKTADEEDDKEESAEDDKETEEDTEAEDEPSGSLLEFVTIDTKQSNIETAALRVETSSNAYREPEPEENETESETAGEEDNETAEESGEDEEESEGTLKRATSSSAVPSASTSVPSSTVTVETVVETPSNVIIGTTYTEGTKALAGTIYEAVGLEDATGVAFTTTFNMMGYEEETVTYEAEDGGIYVTVNAPVGAVPEDAELVVTRFDEDSEDFAEAAEAIGFTEDNEDMGMAALDISFIVDGEEYEPEKEVEVIIDASDIIPEDVDPTTLEVTHLEEENSKIKPVIMANRNKGKIDTENAIATFSVKSFSSFTITWGTGASETEVTVYLYDINGLGIYDSDEQGTYTWAAGEHTIANLISEHVSNKISDSYTYVYATVQYLTTSNQGGSVTTIGSESDPVISVSWNGTNYVVTTQNGSTTTVTKSDTVAAEFYINLYFSTPTVEISVTGADSTNHTVNLTADAENFQNNSITYTWEIIDGAEYASVTGTESNATVTWNNGVASGSTITVRVTATSASGESAIALYELTYGMQQVTYTVYYGATGTSGTIASGASVALLDENGNVVSNGTTDSNGQVTLWVVPGTTYTLEASYTASSGTGIQMTYVHYSYENGNYTYTDGDATNIYMTESGANLYEHVDVKLSIADPDSEGYSDILANVDYVNIYDEAGNLVYQSSQLVHNSGTNDYNVLFADAEGNVGDNPHSIAFYDSYTIVIGYEVSYTYEEDGETKEYTESYVATIDKNSTYIEDEYYSYSGTNAYQLYNEIYGTDYSESEFLVMVDDETLPGYDEHGIALNGLNYFFVAAALCDTKDTNNQAGLDLALGVGSLRRYSSTTWVFDIQKTLVNSATTDGQFTFDLYEANPDEEENWLVDVSAYAQEGGTNGYVLTVNGNAADLEDGKSISIMTDSYTFSVDSSMAGVTNSYYFILYENNGESEGVAYDTTVYGIKLDVTLNSTSDLTNVTINETYYELEYSDSSDGYNIYTVSESENELTLTKDGDGNTIYPFTNTYAEYIDITVNKAWDDSDNQDGERPKSIQVKLVTGEVESDEPVTLDSDNNWSYTWKDLPVFAEEGGEITYTVTEVEVPEDYQSTVGDLTPVYDDENNFVGYTITITNIHESAETDISVVKVWDDEDNQDGVRPESVTVQLKADDEVYGSPVELDDSNNWRYSWGELPLHNGSTDYIIYTVEEVEVDDRYTPTVTGAVETDDEGTVTGYVFTVTNTHTPEETSLTVTKVWDDEDDQDGIRPASIQVKLVTDGIESDGAVELNSGNNWSYTWEGLPVYSNGVEISYTVIEDTEAENPDGYTPTYGDITRNDDGSYSITITNKHTPDTTSLTVTKNWVNEGDITGTSVQVQLMADDKAVGDPVTLTGSDNWKHTWTDLPVNSNGTNVIYTIKEVTELDGYASNIGSLTIDNDGNYSVTITNTRTTGSVTFGGEKTIKGISGTNQTFTFSLYASNEEFKVNDDVSAISTKSVEGAGLFTFAEISYDSTIDGNGAGIYYYVVKETSTDENGWTMDTNEYHITVDVTYSDGDSTFKLQVTCTDAEGAPVSLTQAEDGSYSFTGLDFENNYEAAPTSVQFTGTKYITNSTSTEKVFTFELYTTANDFSIEGLTPEQVSTEGEITSSGQEFKFDAINYEEAGTHYYVIQEKALDVTEGWTIDSKVYNITVVVSDNGLGQLETTLTVDGQEAEVAGTTTSSDDGSTQTVYGGFDFTNAYYMAEGNVTLGVVKSISGIVSTDKTFSFTLYDSNEDFELGNSLETITTVGTITNSTSLNFTSILYTEEKEVNSSYYYVIKETGTNSDGWTLDEKEYHVTVTVADNGNGTLETSVSYAYVDENGVTQTGTSAAFTNTYIATGELILTGKKTYEGGTLGTNVFDFQMIDSEGERVAGVTMDSDGNITFPTLKYNETNIGESYRYTISEINTDGSSIVYDDTIYTVVVSVADNGDGTLSVTYTVTSDDEEKNSIEFVNYQKGSLTISKTFTGLTDAQIESLSDFEITVKNSAGNTVATLKLSNATKGDDENYTWIVSDLDAGTYTVTETGYSLDGYEVIAESGEVKVTNGSSVFVDDELAWGGEDEVTFTNDYTEVGSLTISKYVVAEEDIQKKHEDTQYTVVITASEDADFQWVTVTSSSGREITPTIDGKTITFTITEDETVTIDRLPTGEYTVEEKDSDALTSDHVVPSYRVGDGQTETEYAPTVTVSSGSNNVVSVEIDNEYPVGTYIEVKKNYNKDEYPTGEDVFTFTIEALSADLDSGAELDASEMPMPEETTVTITGSDEGHVRLITFDDEENEFEHFGKYYYKITEAKGSLDNVEYDETVHYVRVDVGFDSDTHVITTDEWQATEDAETGNYKDLVYTEASIVTAEFTNTAYEELSIEKGVLGNAGDISDYEFEITLTKDDKPYIGDISMIDPDSGEVTGEVTFNDEGKGTVTITAGETITLLVPSGYDCVITEKTADADSVNVSVDGVYQAQETYTEATAEVGTIAASTQVVFVNSYRAYYPINEEIVTDEDNIFDTSKWVKDESVNEYNGIEIEMTTMLPVVTPYDLTNGQFTMDFHEVLDSALVLDENNTDFTVWLKGNSTDPIEIKNENGKEYFTVTISPDEVCSMPNSSSEAEPASIRPYAETGNAVNCSFHVDVDLTALYNDEIIGNDEITNGDTWISIFFFADLEGKDLNGSYTSTIWYDVKDAGETLYTSNVEVVAVYTYEIDLYKYNSVNDAALEGATFGIYYDEDCDEPVYRYAGGRFSGSDPEEYKATSDESGSAMFYGLAEGTYYIEETSAPEGFAKLDKPITIELGSDSTNDDHVHSENVANTPDDDNNGTDGGYYSLSLGKAVTGALATSGYQSRSYSFTVTLTELPEGEELSGITGTKYYSGGDAYEGSITFDENGEATFSLKKNEYVKFENIPSGTHYEITENETIYTATVTEGSASGTITGNTSVTVSNSIGYVPASGGGGGGGGSSSGGGTSARTNTDNTGPGADVVENDSSENDSSDHSGSSVNTDSIGGLPATGEGNTMMILIVVCVALAAVLVVLFYMRRKTPNDQA